jgi:pyruvate kinase
MPAIRRAGSGYGRRVTRRTKIVATLGPASSDADTIRAMVRAGMDVARISLAHTSLVDALALHALVREVTAGASRPIGTMVDLPGPIIRIGRPDAERVTLSTGERVELRTGNGPTGPDTVFIDYPWLLEDVFVGDRLHLGESATVDVEAVAADHLVATVTFDGVLTGRGAVKLPRESRPLPVVTERVRDEIRQFTEAGVDLIAASARNSADLDELGVAPHSDPKLVLKIESMEAYERLHELIPRSDAIIVGRGGLGLEAPLADLPHIQKQIIEECIASGRAVIVASQMLDSMITAPTPTRAEATDVSNAVLDGGSALMLSAETAVGDHPVRVVETIARIAARADSDFDHERWARKIARMRMADSAASDDVAITDAITIGAARATADLGIDTLLCVTTSGFTAYSIARFRPRAAIIAVSPKEETVRQLTASWGVTPLHYSPPSTEFIERVDAAIERAKDAGLLATGQLIGIVTGISAGRGATDTFRITRVP